MKTRKMKGGDYVYDYTKNEWVMSSKKAESLDDEVRSYHASELEVLNFLAKRQHNYQNIYDDTLKATIEGMSIPLNNRIQEAIDYLRENVDTKSDTEWMKHYEPFRQMIEKLRNTVSLRERVDKIRDDGKHKYVTRMLNLLLDQILDLDNGRKRFSGGINYREKYDRILLEVKNANTIAYAEASAKAIADAKARADAEASAIAFAHKEIIDKHKGLEDMYQSLVETEANIDDLLSKYRDVYIELDEKDKDSFEGHYIYSRMDELEKKKDKLTVHHSPSPARANASYASKPKKKGQKNNPAKERMDVLFKKLLDEPEGAQKARIVAQLKQLPRLLKRYDENFLQAQESDIEILDLIVKDFLKTVIPKGTLQKLIDLIDNIKSRPFGGTKRKFKRMFTKLRKRTLKFR